MNNEKKSENIICYAMISPMIIGFLVFTIYPLVWIMRYAFYDYDGINAIFIGLDNFKRIFTTEAGYWMSVVNALIISYGKLIVEIPLALVLAVVLGRKLRGSGFFRGIYFMPTVIGVSISAVVFSKIFATHGGIMNDILCHFNIIKEPINFFGHKWTAILVIMIRSVWANFGTNVLFFMAGVQGISTDYYEAAEIDGATGSQQFFKITLPLLMPITRTILLLAMTSGVKLMDEVLLLTNGGPGGSTNVVMLYMYKYFFTTDITAQIGFAAAMGIVTSIILCILSVVYLKLSERADKVI